MAEMDMDIDKESSAPVVATQISLETPHVSPKDLPLSDHSGNGSNGGDISDFGDWDDSRDDGGRREYWFTPRGAYRTAVFWGICSIASLFATVSTIVEIHWAHSKHWVPIPIPKILVANTFLLLFSSVTAAYAEFLSVRGRRARSALFLRATLFLGLVFLAGQIVGWHQMAAQGFYLGSSLGSFFFYFLTAAHAVHLAGGILALAYVVLRAEHLHGAGLEQASTESVVLYWHFMDGLWVYLLVLLYLSIHRA